MDISWHDMKADAIDARVPGTVGKLSGSMTALLRPVVSLPILCILPGGMPAGRRSDGVGAGRQAAGGGLTCSRA